MANKTLKTIMQGCLWFLIIVTFFIPSTIVHAADFSQQISSEDKAAFDQMLSPVMKIYNFVKYAASVVAVVIMLIAGIAYMVSGSDVKKRDNAKNMAGMVVVGLLVVWIAPYGVNYLVG